MGTFRTKAIKLTRSAHRSKADLATARPKSENDPGCVKTCASRERAELSSPFSSFDHDGQCCSFLIQRNRDKLSTRKFDVGVFTQPGSKADLGCLAASSVWTAGRAIANCDR